VLNARRGASKIVLLTTLGGGAFGNDSKWIYAAMRRALQITSDADLDVKIVSHGEAPQDLLEIAKEFDRGGRDAR
jgi:hypothetical protein